MGLEKWLLQLDVIEMESPNDPFQMLYKLVSLKYCTSGLSAPNEVY